jgi:FkbM family methyltransferase
MTKFYKKTGMYIDWEQISKLPEIDTFIDIGVGPKGTQMFWEKYFDKKIFCIDPLIEAQKIANQLLKGKDFVFLKYALGSSKKEEYLNIEEEDKGRASILKATDINVEGEIVEKLKVEVVTLDEIIKNKSSLGRIGIKIDTEGYELDVLKGATETLKNTKFVIAEVRHNHLSFENQYCFKEFNQFMFEKKFLPSIIFTAKPFIIDICYEKII